MKKQINKIAGIALSFALLLTLIPVGNAADDQAIITANIETGISLSNNVDVTLTVSPIAGFSTDDTKVGAGADGSDSVGNVLTITNNDSVGFNINVKLTAQDASTPDDLSSVVPALSSFIKAGSARIEASEPGVAGDSQTIELSYTDAGGTTCATTGGAGTGNLIVTCESGAQAVGDITLDEGDAEHSYQVNIGDNFGTKTPFDTDYATTAEAIALNITNNIAGYTATNTGAVIDITATDYGVDTLKVDIVMRDSNNDIVANTMTTTDMSSGADGASSGTFISEIDGDSKFNATGGAGTDVVINLLPATTYTLANGADATTAALADENGTIQFTVTQSTGLSGGHDNNTGAAQNYINYGQNLVFYVNEDEALSIVDGAELNIDHYLTATSNTASGAYLGTVIFTMIPNA